VRRGVARRAARAPRPPGGPAPRRGGGRRPPPRRGRRRGGKGDGPPPPIGSDSMSGEAQSTAADRLGHIEAVLDARLGDLGVEDRLDELLDRVRETLATDTAAILLLDEPNGQLVARAARGLE